MESSLIKVLIVDDEPLVRRGIRYLIDWEQLGFFICGQAENGQEALEQLARYQPSLILLDIRMPQMYGTDFMRLARASGFDGEFIILSGYPDFQYAQTALRYGASYYLSKPIDEKELEDAVLSVKNRLEKRREENSSFTQYQEKAKTTVLQDLFVGDGYEPSINYSGLNLYAPIYQLIIYEAYTPFYAPYNLAELLQGTDSDSSGFEQLSINSRRIILLKGDSAIDRFRHCLAHYENSQKGSPLDSIFLAYSPAIPHLSGLKNAYLTCLSLLERRFFCEENQHVLSPEELPEQLETKLSLSQELSLSYGQRLTDYLKTYNRRGIYQTLTELQETLFCCSVSIISIRHFLANIFLDVKQNIMHSYEMSAEIPFAHNGAIIELIENCSYLYEILQYFSEQFEMILRAIGDYSRESVFDDILYYIHHNYSSPLKLGQIAPLFGYSSAYLGKLFLQKTENSFNAYLNKIRIEQAAKLLTDTDQKVYEIAAKVGYKKTDLFHQKFREIMNVSPAEYRKQQK